MERLECCLVELSRYLVRMIIGFMSWLDMVLMLQQIKLDEGLGNVYFFYQGRYYIKINILGFCIDLRVIFEEKFVMKSFIEYIDIKICGKKELFFSI